MKFCSYDLRYNGQCLSGREIDRGSTFDRNTQRVRRVPQIEHVFVDRLSGASELVGSSNTRERERERERDSSTTQPFPLLFSDCWTRSSAAASSRDLPAHSSTTHGSIYGQQFSSEVCCLALCTFPAVQLKQKVDKRRLILINYQFSKKRV